VSERPRYESDTSLLLPISIDDHGRNVLLADQPREKEANVEALLSECLCAGLQIGAAQLGELSVR